MKPVVSVLIITYNQEKYIEQAILGAINQKCNFPFEIVIGEDCSSDKTLEICNHYQKIYPNNIRVIANKTNKGLLNNYFDTLLLCQGKYIADCAGDDFWTDEYKLHRQVEILENNPNSSLTYTDYSHYLQDSNTFIHNRQTFLNNKPQKHIRTYQDDVYELLNQHEHPFIFVGTSCFRMSAFLNSYNKHTEYFRNPIYTCEDFQLTFFLLKEGDFYYEDIETTAYRIIPNTISRQKDLTKQFSYTYGAFLLRMNLMNQFKFKVSKCKEFMTIYYIPLLSLTTILNLKEEQNKIIDIYKKTNYRPTLQVRFHLLIASNKLLSKLFRYIKTHLLH